MTAREQFAYAAALWLIGSASGWLARSIMAAWECAR